MPQGKNCRETIFAAQLPHNQETTKDPNVEALKGTRRKLSEFGNSSLQGYESSKTPVLLCLGTIREGRMPP